MLNQKPSQFIVSFFSISSDRNLWLPPCLLSCRLESGVSATTVCKILCVSCAPRGPLFSRWIPQLDSEQLESLLESCMYMIAPGNHLLSLFESWRMWGQFEVKIYVGGSLRTDFWSCFFTLCIILLFYSQKNLGCWQFCENLFLSSIISFLVVHRF